MFRFLRSQLMVTPSLPPSASFTDQVAIVTGANVGLGLEAARHISRLGARKVILAVRNVLSGDEARRSIEESTGRVGVCEVWPLDLASYASVIAFAHRAQALPRLDIVLENAAVATTEFQLAEGHELSITVNVINTMFLALLLLPKLRETARRSPLRKPHLTVVVSEAHAFTSFPEWRQECIFEALDDNGATDMNERYPTSKLLEILALRELIVRMSDDAVIINMVNPGLCHSRLSRDAGMSMAIMKFFLARSTEVGSRTLVTGIVAGSETHGSYMSNCLVASHELSAFVRSEDGDTAQKKIWQELCEMLEVIQPGVTRNL
ncbi:NAD(P)-binding protein [Aspergillus steynii IBT 23096]|uniref:NAD(P)-binding protein n=1 Tax=Aspergillus steynii IBT 23096 TaxID=1392250 RepID=A0A2I2FXG0_9EURO|nr:NAD(P)-binding protein [Aspergillus steynii IBT 23096]PLB45318.1 NAD(P)-binding protein [Aspergillus steynii IBT 23096]